MDGTPERARVEHATVEEVGVTGLLGALDDEDCRALLCAAAERALSASELAESCDLPLSTTYRKLNRLVEAGLLAETVRLRGSGRRRNEYSLRVETVGLSLNPDGIDVTVSGRSRRAHRRSG